jgi:hypothetical protein
MFSSKLFLHFVITFNHFQMISATFCSICGEDTDMGNPQAIIPGSSTITCELLDRAGRIGIIPDHECHLLLHFSTLCECNSLLTLDPDELSRQLYVDNDDNAPSTVPSNHVSPVFDLVEEDDSTKDWGKFVCVCILFLFLIDLLILFYSKIISMTISEPKWKTWIS